MTEPQDFSRCVRTVEASMAKIQGVIQQQLQVIQELANAYTGLAASQEAHYRQAEALHSVFASLDLSHPLPPMRGWAISPDFAVVLIDLLLEHKPTTLVECGSGVSTLLAAHCLRRNGGGKIVALEHVPEFAEATRESLRKHGVEDYAEVRDAPLHLGPIEEREFYWYDVSQLGDVKDIDLLLVDGPPGVIQQHSRWPAIPKLFERLSAEAMVLMDDTNRQDEQEVIALWMEAWPLVNKKSFALEKGAVLLQRTAG
jgi:predicted O-methyltransferase YrrM